MGQVAEPLTGTGSGGGGAAGTGRATASLPASTTNNLNPGSLTGVGRLILTAGSGAASVSGLIAGTDGQYLFIYNNDPTNTITLLSQNAGSTAANRFAYLGDLQLVPGEGVLAVYDATIARWLL